MECAQPTPDSADDPAAPASQVAAAASPSSRATGPIQYPAEPSVDHTKLGPDDAAKRTKHTRVHKREKELYGLVTPVFLPLLEAEQLPDKKPKDKKKATEERTVHVGGIPSAPDQASSSRDADKAKDGRKSRSRKAEEKMDRGEGVVVSSEGAKENQKSDSMKKSKRSAVKKSSLRHHNTPRSRRKRVSLVIDDQIVLPADNIAEPPLTSPSETTVSTASNSTTSLDELIDPRLMPHNDAPDHHVHVHHEHREHRDPMHHSLPLPTSLPSTSPTKHTGHTLSGSPSYLEYGPPQTATHTFLDPSTSNAEIRIPQHASADPIFSNESELLDEEETLEVETEIQVDPGNEEFSTYVGGLSGSGVDNVDQAGSYGYPSSLGASYLESYMKSRPLSVRIAAADKAGLQDREKQELIRNDDGEKEDGDFHLKAGRVDDVDEGMEVIGSMEDDF